MLRTGSINGDKRQVNISSSHTGKVDFCLFCGFLNSLHSHFIARNINAVLCLKISNNPIHNTLIEVIAAKTVITGCSQNLLNAVAHLDNRNIESTAAEVINHNLLVVFLIDTVGKSRSSRLIDNTLYIKTRNLTCILCCLTLCIGEVSRNCNNCLGYGSADISLGIIFKLLQNNSRYFLRSVSLTVNIYGIRSAHLTLNRHYGTFGVGNSLTFCNLTYHSFTGL